MNAICVVAHPDDCIIFGYGLINQFQNLNWTICYLTYTDDSPRGEEISRFWQKRNISTKFLGFKDDWNDIENDSISFDVLIAQQAIEDCVEGQDIILSHNSDGEYGHLHHKFVNQCLHNKNNLVTFASLYVADIKITLPPRLYDLDELPLHREVISSFHKHTHTNGYTIPNYLKHLLISK
jgi:hypothetical protein